MGCMACCGGAFGGVPNGDDDEKGVEKVWEDPKLFIFFDWIPNKR